MRNRISEEYSLLDIALVSAGITLVILKILVIYPVVNWSWLWVTAPFWMLPIVTAIALLLVVIGISFGAYLSTLALRHERNRLRHIIDKNAVRDVAPHSKPLPGDFIAKNNVVIRVTTPISDDVWEKLLKRKWVAVNPIKNGPFFEVPGNPFGYLFDNICNLDDAEKVVFSSAYRPGDKLGWGA